MQSHGGRLTLNRSQQPFEIDYLTQDDNTLTQNAKTAECNLYEQ